MEDLQTWLKKLSPQWDKITHEELETHFEKMQPAKIIGGHRYYVYVPEKLKKKTGPHPLMVVLHGCDQEAHEIVISSKMSWLAQKEGFIVLFPDPILVGGKLEGFLNGWNWWEKDSLKRTGPEPGLIAKMIKAVRDEYPIDEQAIYVCGISAGAAMTVIMAVTYPDLISGIGICAGLHYKAAIDSDTDSAISAMGGSTTNPFTTAKDAWNKMKKYPRTRMPVIVFQGEADAVVNPVNGHNVIEQWLAIHSLLSEDMIDPAADPHQEVYHEPGKLRSERFVYHDKTGNALLEKWMITDMNHCWPGGQANCRYSHPLGPPATAIMWHFFRRQSQNPGIK
ncbi:MAG: alpha/beta hydrolase family esterase [Solirubrobacterales bacterium]